LWKSFDDVEMVPELGNAEQTWMYVTRAMMVESETIIEEGMMLANRYYDWMNSMFLRRVLDRQVLSQRSKDRPHQVAKRYIQSGERYI
jgi:hypothetical protein